MMGLLPEPLQKAQSGRNGAIYAVGLKNGTKIIFEQVTSQGLGVGWLKLENIKLIESTPRLATEWFMEGMWVLIEEICWSADITVGFDIGSRRGFSAMRTEPANNKSSPVEK